MSRLRQAQDIGCQRVRRGDADNSVLDSLSRYLAAIRASAEISCWPVIGARAAVSAAVKACDEALRTSSSASREPEGVAMLTAVLRRRS